MTFPATAWPLGSATHATKVLRMAQGGLLGRPTALFTNSVSPTTAGGSHGVVGENDLKVSFVSGTTVAIAAGNCFINGSSSIDQGAYGGAYNNAAQNVVCSAHSVSTRIDLIYVRVRDNDEDASASEDLVVDKVTGTPGAGVPAVLANSLVLAEVSWPATSGSPTITDRRPYATALGGTHRCLSTTRPTGAALYDGLRIWEVDTKSELAYNSTTAAWEILTEPRQTWSFGIAQPGAVASTVSFAYRQRSRGGFRAHGNLAITGTGTASTAITIDLPYTLTDARGVGGTWWYYDGSASRIYSGSVYANSTTRCGFVCDDKPGALGAEQFGSSPNVQMASGDTFCVSLEGWYA